MTGLHSCALFLRRERIAVQHLSRGTRAARAARAGIHPSSTLTTTTTKGGTMRNYVGLSFPVIRVRFSGPTDHHGARYVASLRSPLGRVQHFEPFHAGPEGPSELAHKAARGC